MSARGYFLYRIFDADGRLLYVGCTNRPYTRWAEHRAQNRRMASRAASWRMQGPYTRIAARALEKVALHDEQPLFGLTPQKQSAIMRASWWERHRAAELMQGGWDFDAAHRLAASEVKQEFPESPTSYCDIYHPWEAQA